MLTIDVGNVNLRNSRKQVYGYMYTRWLLLDDYYQTNRFYRDERKGQMTCSKLILKLTDTKEKQFVIVTL